MSRDSTIANMIAEIYLMSDCRYGYRKITAEITRRNMTVNHKKVLKMMKTMNIQGLYPKKRIRTSIALKEHKIYPYLLEGLLIVRVHQVWTTDITYIFIENRFMYFIAIMDLYSRYIISYELSPYLEAGFCIYALKIALSTATPEIFNTDQGSQFTSNDFIKELSSKNIKISMDHKGRCFDNIFSERLWRTLKQEAIYYYRPASIAELNIVIENFVDWYNNKRLHQSLDYKTPAEVYGK
jgi:putative transposase